MVISIIQQQATKHPIEVATFSPTMDLLAMVSGDKSLSIWRFIPWQKIFSKSAPAGAGFTAISWSEDGSRFAAGCENGVLMLFDAETMHVLAETQLSSSAIASLAWKRDELSKDRVKSSHFDRCLSILPSPHTPLSSDGMELDFLKPRQSYFAETGNASMDSLNVTTEADEQIILLGGRLEILRIEGRKCSPHVHAANIGVLMTLISSPCLALEARRTVLGEREAEMCLVSTLIERIGSCLDRLETNVLCVKTKWLESIKDVAAFWNEIPALQSKASEPFLSPRSVMLRVSMTGAFSASSEQFVEHFLTSSRIAKVAKQVNDLCSSLEVALCGHCQEAAQELLIRLEEFRGFCRCKSLLEPLGFDCAEISRGIEAAALVFKSVESLAAAIHEIRADWSRLFSWMGTLGEKCREVQATVYRLDVEMVASLQSLFAVDCDWVAERCRRIVERSERAGSGFVKLQEGMEEAEAEVLSAEKQLCAAQEWLCGPKVLQHLIEAVGPRPWVSSIRSPLPTLPTSKPNAFVPPVSLPWNEASSDGLEEVFTLNAVGWKPVAADPAEEATSDSTHYSVVHSLSEFRRHWGAVLSKVPLRVAEAARSLPVNRVELAAEGDVLDLYFEDKARMTWILCRKSEEELLLLQCESGDAVCLSRGVSVALEGHVATAGAFYTNKTYREDVGVSSVVLLLKNRATDGFEVARINLRLQEDQEGLELAPIAVVQDCLSVCLTGIGGVSFAELEGLSGEPGLAVCGRRGVAAVFSSGVVVLDLEEAEEEEEEEEEEEQT